MSADNFENAASWLIGTPAAASLSNDVKLELYGIYKYASTGSGPAGARPGMFAFEAKAKYDAWAAASAKYGADGSSVDEAKERYVEIAKSIGFEPEAKHQGGTGMGPSVSVMAAEEEYEGPNSMVHDAASSGSVNDLKAILLLDPGRLNALDEFGYTALHRAADRGHADAAAYLLSLGADKTIVDQDGMTALEIAEISGRDDVVALLK